VQTLFQKNEKAHRDLCEDSSWDRGAYIAGLVLGVEEQAARTADKVADRG